MPRRYYRRRVYVRPKRKWATKMYNTNGAIATSGDSGCAHNILVANSGDIDVPTPTIIKCGNVKIQLDLGAQLASAASIDAVSYVIYVPQGTLVNNADYTTTRQFIEAHPEYIMAWRRIDGNNYAATVSFTAVQYSSRLKRNLNTGDQLRHIILMASMPSGTNISNARYAITATINCCNN